jgi:hypothetical protein
MADKHATGNHRKCNQVSQEEIWKESVLREYTAAKRWEKNWGFMVQFDSKVCHVLCSLILVAACMHSITGCIVLICM